MSSTMSTEMLISTKYHTKQTKCNSTQRLINTEIKNKLRISNNKQNENQKYR